MTRPNALKGSTFYALLGTTVLAWHGASAWVTVPACMAVLTHSSLSRHFDEIQKMHAARNDKKAPLAAILLTTKDAAIAAGGSHLFGVAMNYVF